MIQVQSPKFAVDESQIKMKRLRIFILATLSALTVVAENRDSLPLDSKTIIENRLDIDTIVSQNGLSFQNQSQAAPAATILNSVPLSMPVLRPALFLPGNIASWTGGGLYSVVSHEHMPGLMTIERGGFNVGQQIGDFSFSAYVEALHYGTYYGLRRQTGAGISLTYRISPTIGVTLYGSLYSRPGIMNPAMAGYTYSSAAGGYVDWRISDRFGVKAGGRVERNMATNQWRAQPTLEPYVRINGSAAKPG